MLNVYEKVFGENHEKNLWELSPEDMKLLSDARKPERERRRKRTQKIVKQNNRGRR
jgi:hypothetical protein